MGVAERGEAPHAATDADAGIWRGRSVARRFVSPDGFVVLVGRTAADNDVLSMKLADPADVWLHVAGASGSHVVVRNPDQLERLPRDTIRFAASLAAGHSRARAAARAEVHVAHCRDISKPRGAPPGQVALRRFTTVRVVPMREPPGSEPAAER
jgi:predicted ribosome quality control (RQC) complex YloA/Tae2 family protein